MEYDKEMTVFLALQTLVNNSTGAKLIIDYVSLFVIAPGEVICE